MNSPTKTRADGLRKRIQGLGAKPAAPAPQKEPEAPAKNPSGNTGAEALVSSALQAILQAVQAETKALREEMAELRKIAMEPTERFERLLTGCMSVVEANTEAMDRIAALQVNVEMPKAPKAKAASKRKVSFNLGDRVVDAVITES